MIPDTAATIHHGFNEAWRNKMLLDPNYIYRSRPRSTSLLERLWMAFVDWLSKLVNPSYDGMADLVGYVIIAGVVILVITLIVRSRKQGLLETSGLRASNVAEEQLEAAPDIDRLIGVAVADANYRLAVRLLYRRTLAEMRDLAMISYRPEKTDVQYVQEIQSSPAHGPFKNAVSLFHQVWYGMEEVHREQYDAALHAFNLVRSQLFVSS